MVRLNEALRADMTGKGIDIALSLSILEDWNSGFYADARPVVARGIPAVDGERVIDVTGPLEYLAPSSAETFLREEGVRLPPTARREGDRLRLDRAALDAIGLDLLPRASWGVLNGGSATSYADRKKNLAYGEEVFRLLEPGFTVLEPLCRDRPKGLAPAFLNPDDSPGPSFLTLKMRARILLARAYARRHGTVPPDFLPLFQMTSAATDGLLSAAYGEATSDPLLAEAAAPLGGVEALRATSWRTGIQPLIAAYTHSAEGPRKTIFDRAWGRPNCALALPGGHGQSFRVLAEVFRDLLASGHRWAWMGNVDNLAFLPDPALLAVFALSGEPAAFEFAFRTPLDVKGGILVETDDGRRTIADIGPAIGFEEVRRLEGEGASALFNCATGLFDLRWLVPRLEELGRAIPLRFTDQDKDAGRYSQAEQVTWEIASLLPSFLAFAVAKDERFIAAKLLAETLLASGRGRDDPRVPGDLARASESLERGLAARLAGPYGLSLSGGRWVAAGLR